MDIPGIIGSAVDTAFNVFDSVAKGATYFRVTAGPYDATSGAVTAAIQNYACRVVFGVFEQDEIDGELIKFGDMKIFIKSSEVTVEPGNDDYLILSNNERYEVALIRLEPTR